jgi:hypothetical protein
MRFIAGAKQTGGKSTLTTADGHNRTPRAQRDQKMRFIAGRKQTVEIDADHG